MAAETKASAPADNPPFDPADVVKRAKAAWSRKDPMLALLQDVYQYAMPDRDTISHHAAGAKRNLLAFDSTAITGTLRFANRIQKDLFPPYRKWITLEGGPDVPAEIKEQVDLKLEELNDRLFRHIHESPFDTALNEALQDLAAGTGVLLIENGRSSTGRTKAPLFRVQALPATNVAFEEGPFGAIEGYFYKRKVKARDLERVFPGGNLPQAWTGNNDPEFEYEFFVCAYYDWKNDKYWIDTVCEQGEDKAAHRVQFSHAKTSPFIAFRWTKAAGEIEGRGPLIMALPDIKTLNKVVELILKNASLAISGIYTAADDGVLNPATIRLTPGNVIPVAQNGGPRGRSLDVLPRAGDFNVAELVIDKLQTQIKTHLFDKSLPPDTGPVRSPTEIVARIKELQSDTGAPFGRLIVELQIPVALRFLDIADQAGEIPMPLKVDGREVAVVPRSPLARASALEDVQAIADFLSIAGPLGPQAVAKGLHSDKAPKFLATAIGVPRPLIPTEDDVKAQNEAAAKQAETEQLAGSPVVAKGVEQIGEAAREEAARKSEGAGAA